MENSHKIFHVPTCLWNDVRLGGSINAIASILLPAFLQNAIQKWHSPVSKVWMYHIGKLPFVEPQQNSPGYDLTCFVQEEKGAASAHHTSQLSPTPTACSLMGSLFVYLLFYIFALFPLNQACSQTHLSYRTWHNSWIKTHELTFVWPY